MANLLLRFQSICVLSLFDSGDFLINVLIRKGICWAKEECIQLSHAWTLVSASVPRPASSPGQISF